MENENVNYLTNDQASEFVERIALRAENFNHNMSEPEKEAMAELLSDVGVKTSDLIDVSNLADNYAINAEIVTHDEVEDYSKDSLNDALFTWQENGETHYCLSCVTCPIYNSMKSHKILSQHYSYTTTPLPYKKN